jgi:MFS family permease
MRIDRSGTQGGNILTSKIDGNAVAEWRAHWPLVLAACVGYGASIMVSYSSSLFIEPLHHDFGWTRAQIMSGHSIAAVAGMIFAPFTGYFVDKLGPRRLGIVAVTAICIATALFSFAGPNIWAWRALWLPMSFAIVLIQPSVWTAAITSLFSAGRGLALAVMLCGGSLSSIVTPPLTYYLILHFGWRFAWVGLAAFWALASLPLIFFFFTSAKDDQRLSKKQSTTLTTQRQSLWQSGMMTRRYVQLLVAAVCIAAVVVTLGTSLVPILSSNGLTRGQAAAIASLSGCIRYYRSFRYWRVARPRSRAVPRGILRVTSDCWHYDPHLRSGLLVCGIVRGAHLRVFAWRRA